MLPHRRRRPICRRTFWLFDELKLMKQQQWHHKITNYSLLILAAIYAMRQLLPEVPHSQTYLKISAGVIAVAGSILLLCIQSNMARSRWRLDNLYKNFFTSNELEAVGWTDKEIWKLQYRPWRRKLAYWCGGLEFTVPLILVLVAGAVLVCLAL
jgi:formate/nitrite transporter FocA (FNT family)